MGKIAGVINLIIFDSTDTHYVLSTQILLNEKVLCPFRILRTVIGFL